MALYKNDEIKKVNFDAIPKEMKEIPQWFMWKAIPKDNRISKVPFTFDGKNATSYNDHSIFKTFDEVKAQYNNVSGFAGIGFSPTNTNITIVDLDMKVDEETGELIKGIEEKEKPFLNAGYVENSVSGRGYHVILNQKPNSTVGTEKNFKDAEGNEIEVYHSNVNGWIAVTGDVYENHSEIDNEEISKQFIDYLHKNYKTKNDNAHISDLESHTEQLINLDSFIPPKVNTSEALNLWINTGGKTLKTRNVDKMALWRREDAAMEKYNFNRSEASYAIVYELAYFMWDNLEGLHSLIVNNRFWNEPDNYMKANSHRIWKYDIKEAIKRRKRSGKLYQRPASQNIGNQAASNKFESEEEKRRKSMLEQYKKSNVKNNMQAFRDELDEKAKTPPTSTGFPLLDEALNGGMREGLTVIGAISSLGKTTMAQQIADNVAKNGKDVIFFSLEMARSELMSKSISHETYLDIIENGGNIKDARTSIDISDPTRRKNFTQRQHEIIEIAMKRYEEYGNHLYIVEAFGQIGFEHVRELVEIHKEVTGNTPIVVIDYLQIMKPSDSRATERTNIDVNVNGLKRICRDFKTTIIAISSLSRQHYNSPMSLGAFKESGAIEYSSDVLIGLDFTKMLEDSTKIDFEEEKDKLPRNITLTILKNRTGRTGQRINYLYDPRFNHFEEDEYFQKKSTKKQKNPNAM